MKSSQEILQEMKTYVRGDTIAQADFDEGDSACRVGTFFALGGMSKIAAPYVLEYEKAISAHTVRPGIYRRAADLHHWGYNENNLSRDQWSSLQLTFAVREDKQRLKESALQVLKQFGFMQNVHPGTGFPQDYRKLPDILHPNNVSVFIRGMNLWYLRPLLPVIDLFYLGDVLTRSFTDEANDRDNLLAPSLLYANVKYPTLVSKLAMKLYLKSNFVSKLYAYHSVERNGILPLADLFVYAYTINNYLD